MTKMTALFGRLAAEGKKREIEKIAARIARDGEEKVFWEEFSFRSSDYLSVFMAALELNKTHRLAEEGSI